jgi:hypothetical protein
MTTIKKDGSNWSAVVNANLQVNSKLSFEDGFCCRVLEYIKAHAIKKGSKTTLKIKVGKEAPYLIETDRLRAEHCPDYQKTEHKPKAKKGFCFENLESATTKELTDALKAIQEEQKRREEAKQKQIAELEAQLAALRA